jgi:hypothetical protein
MTKHVTDSETGTVPYQYSIEADSPMELFAEVAMIGHSAADDPVATARRCERIRSLPVVRWLEELDARGYGDVSVGRRDGKWQATVSMRG